MSEEDQSTKQSKHVWLRWTIFGAGLLVVLLLLSVALTITPRQSSVALSFTGRTVNENGEERWSFALINSGPEKHMFMTMISPAVAGNVLPSTNADSMKLESVEPIPRTSSRSKVRILMHHGSWLLTRRSRE